MVGVGGERRCRRGVLGYLVGFSGFYIKKWKRQARLATIDILHNSRLDSSALVDL